MAWLPRETECACLGEGLSRSNWFYQAGHAGGEWFKEHSGGEAQKGRRLSRTSVHLSPALQAHAPLSPPPPPHALSGLRSCRLLSHYLRIRHLGRGSFPGGVMTDFFQDSRAHWINSSYATAWVS